MTDKLGGKVALITGAARGLGKEFALAYATEGAAIAIVDWNSTELEKVRKQISTIGNKVISISADVRRKGQIEKMVKSIIQKFGKIDVLVPCAGGTMGLTPGPIWTHNLKTWELVMDINVTGVFLTMQASLPTMMKQKSGSIILISSWTAKPKSRPLSFGPYAIAKYAIEQLNHLSAVELESFGIRVNALDPGGPCATPDALSFIGYTGGRLSEDQLRIIREFPHGPFLDPSVIRPLAVFLASDDSKSVTGESLICRDWNVKNGFGEESKYYWDPNG